MGGLVTQSFQPNYHQLIDQKLLSHVFLILVLIYYLLHIDDDGFGVCLIRLAKQDDMMHLCPALDRSTRTGYQL